KKAGKHSANGRPLEPEPDNNPPNPPSGGAKGKGRRAKKDPLPRPPNPIWDAVCATFGMNPQTESERSRVGRVVRDLNIKGATPEEITRRFGCYVAKWPNAARTPEALLKHWDQFPPAAGQAAAGETPQERATRLAATAERRRREAAERERAA